MAVSRQEQGREVDGSLNLLNARLCNPFLLLKYNKNSAISD